MIRYVLRRLWQAVITIVGVMLITFLLFRAVSGDVTAAWLGEKATASQRAAWRHRYGYDRPLVFNYHRQLQLNDRTVGQSPLSVRDAKGGQAAGVLGLILADMPAPAEGAQPQRPAVLVGRYVWNLNRETPLAEMTAGKPLAEKAAVPDAGDSAAPPETAPATQPVPATAGSAAPALATATAPAVTTTTSALPAQPEAQAPPARARPVITFTLGDGSSLAVDLADVQTCGELIDRINGDPANKGRLTAGVTEWRLLDLFNTQFSRHLVMTVTFQGRSLRDNRQLTEIIAEKGPYSLALTVPAFALEWMLGLMIACFVAYYRDTAIDKIGVFLTVLGMSIPVLAVMMYGQTLMFWISPSHAYGISSRVNIFVPVMILVIAGLGGQVRFYRTIILDETNRDYVRTALAKGLPLTAVLFKHVLKNCMLPILTSLILSIPFLIMGALVTENYFGIPGLGDLMYTSIQDRNEPTMNALVFLTALIYTIGILLTDLCYAIFDPRIRLR